VDGSNAFLLINCVNLLSGQRQRAQTVTKSPTSQHHLGHSAMLMNVSALFSGSKKERWNTGTYTGLNAIFNDLMMTTCSHCFLVNMCRVIT